METAREYFVVVEDHQMLVVADVLEEWAVRIRANSFALLYAVVFLSLSGRSRTDFSIRLAISGKMFGIIEALQNTINDFRTSGSL